MSEDKLRELMTRAGFEFTDGGHLNLGEASWYTEIACLEKLTLFGQLVAIEAQIALANHMHDVACLQSIPPKGETK